VAGEAGGRRPVGGVRPHRGGQALARSAWATLHVVRRHGGRVQNIVILEIDLPRSLLRRSRKGIWFTRRDVPPARFRRVIDFIEVAGQSADFGETAARAAG